MKCDERKILKILISNNGNCAGYAINCNHCPISEVCGVCEDENKLLQKLSRKYKLERICRLEGDNVLEYKEYKEIEKRN